MLAKKFLIPVLLVLIGVAMGGTFWGKHVASQAHTQVINAVTPEPVDRSQPTQAETHPAPAAEGGHWHGDEWHADEHEPAPVETLAPVNELQQDVDIPVEDTTSVSDRLTLGQILAERGTDIYNIDLNEVPPDLRRKVQYFREKKVWSEKWEKANTDWFQAGKNLDEIDRLHSLLRGVIHPPRPEVGWAEIWLEKKATDLLLHYYSIRNETDIPGMLKTVQFARYLSDKDSQ